jgi:S-adenosylmethionine-diacylglycerol 3-amino-3-carboxypropyl transferase
MKTNLRTKLSDWLTGMWFRWVHGHFLVYNTCWEDPRLDRQAMNLGPDDTVVVITSAGCNALDYALAGPRRVDAVDVNPRQNALLELKIAGIRRLDFQPFFEMFGHGWCKHADALYRTRLRAELAPASRRYWDRHIGVFTSRRGSFYFHGTAGSLAWMINHYVDKVARIRPSIDRLMNAPTIAEQQAVYSRDLHRTFWKGFVRWAMDRDLTLAMLGVPRAQRRQVENTYPGGIARFIEDRVEAVFTRLPLHENYFWRVYLSGHYTAGCCPEYLKPDNFARLQKGDVERISVHTSTLHEFLERTRTPISRFVLLDHMDWLSTHHREALQMEWQMMIDRAAPRARFLWRSGGMSVDFLDDLQITANGQRRPLNERLIQHREFAEQLHSADRVHTYGSFYIADLN